MEKPLFAAFISNAPLPDVNSLEYSELISNVFEAIDIAKSKGINNFMSDTGRGFNMIASLVVLLHKIVYPDVHLHLQIPSKNRTGSWTGKQRKCFNYILANADKYTYFFEKYKNGCITANNRSIIDRSTLIIAYLKPGHFHFDALSYAIEKKCEIILINPKCRENKKIKALKSNYS